MNKRSYLLITLIFSVVFFCCSAPETILLSKDELRNKIAGGWAGQAIGITLAPPLFSPGALIPDSLEYTWYDGYFAWYYQEDPAHYYALYMNLPFVDVIEKEGLEAPLSSFAWSLASMKQDFWHNNQMARSNILRGIMPPQSGHWLNNPHADCVDFQLEADFIGLMSPGMVNTASKYCDKIGHIMSCGDGLYGGVYISAMYALAFFSDDITYIVEEALTAIPEESKFAQCMNDVIQWHEKNPEDWKEARLKVQEKWTGNHLRCPETLFDKYDGIGYLAMDAKINAAWVLIGLLYGEGDFGKTILITSRCGDLSDVNSPKSGGILGTMLGYKNIPDYWKQGLDDVESIDFFETETSLNEVYDLSFKHALEVTKKNGGKVSDNEVVINVQKPKPVKLEVSFEGHYPVERKKLNISFTEEAAFDFEGIGFAINGSWFSDVHEYGDKSFIFNVEMYIDQKLEEVVDLSTKSNARRYTPFWRYQLPKGKHIVHFKVLNPIDGAELRLDDAIIYSNKPSKVPYPSK
jgi:hypothetical protein